MDSATLGAAIAIAKSVTGAASAEAIAAAEAAQSAADIATAAISTQTGFAMSDGGDHMTFVITQS